MTTYFIAKDGARLAYSDQGSGPVLLCLPGLTRTMHDFDYMLPHLPPCRVVRMDYRGRGASAWTGDTTYTVAIEAADVLTLMDHLQIGRAAILGTSRGGLIGLLLAGTAGNRLSGLCLNDIGPVVEREGLMRIFEYAGRNPSAHSHAELAAKIPDSNPGFSGVPPERWLAEARLHYTETPEGLRITYDPALRAAFLTAFSGPLPDAWPLFDACADLPLALIRGANSDIISAETAIEMRRRRPDMIFAEVPGRGHVPFLDEPESLLALRAFLAKLAQ